MKRFLIAGNWKMNTLPDEAVNLVTAVSKGLSGIDLSSIDVLICPPFINLPIVTMQKVNEHIKFGAQNCFFEEKGAFTGEVSPTMLNSIGTQYVILGHSERRTIFLENNEIVNKKIKSAIKYGLKAILCIGETLEQRNSGRTLEIITNQLLEGLKGIEENKSSQIVIAYEPVWAIGTGVSATESQAEEVHTEIRKILSNLYKNAERIPILYGGSMNAENATSLLAQKNIDGGLIGGASLKYNDFLTIIKSAAEISKK